MAPEVTLWTDGEHVALLSKLLDVMGAAISLIAVGGPREPAVDAMSTSLGVAREDDLRKMLIDKPARYLLVAAMAQIQPVDLLPAAGQNTTILAMEPVAADLAGLAVLRPGGRGRGAAAKLRVVHLPAFTQSPGFLRTADPFDLLGDRRMIRFDSYGNHHQGSLFTRLFDAWHTALRFADLPVSVDASLIAEADSMSDDPRRISGRMAVHGRTGEGSVIVLTLRDQAQAARRELHVFGNDGELRIDDAGYDLRLTSGGETESSHEVVADIEYVDLIARQWRRLLDRQGGEAMEDRPEREAEVLACCQACLLSAKTAQPESPRKLWEINR